MQRAEQDRHLMARLRHPADQLSSSYWVFFPAAGSAVRGNVPAGGGRVGHGVDHVSGERVQDTRQKLILFGPRAT